MRKLFLLPWLMVLLSLSVSGQNTGWTTPGTYFHYLPNNSFGVPNLPVPATLCDAGVTPNTSASYVDGYDGQAAEYASNMILNPQGEIEFFIVDGIVYDGNGHYIDALIANGGIATGASEVVIVPDPANCNRYYIITVVKQGYPDYTKFPYVYLLDMSLPNNNVCEDCGFYGALVLQTCPGSGATDYALEIDCVETDYIINGANDDTKKSNCFLAASELQPGGFHWVFISSQYGVFRFRIDGNGITSEGEIISFGNNWGNTFSIRSEMELVSLPGGGFRIAVPYRVNPATTNNAYQNIMVMDLDANADPINGTRIDFPMQYYVSGSVNYSAVAKGIEFSENGDRIYVTHTTNVLEPNQMEYYDFGTTPVALQNFAINSNIDVRSSMLELKGGDTLIIANQNGLYRLPNATTANPSDLSLMWGFNYAPNYEGASFQGPFLEMYMLPDQIDGMDLNPTFTSTVECCIANNVFEAESYVASSGTWSPNVVQNGGQNPLQPAVSPNIYVQKELRIPAGVSVTINDMNLYFAPDARLIVENGNGTIPGGRLTLNNTTLSVDDRCTEDELWLGVEVWGNTQWGQGALSLSNQGSLFLNPESRIEHAQIGVLVGKRNATTTPNGNCPPIVTPQPWSFDYARTGGIVRATGATFFGNQRGMYFLPYLDGTGANNLSQIDRSTFSWDGALRGNYLPKEHVYFRGVKGIFVLGSSFLNVTPSAFDYTQLGTGIFGYDSQFYVQPQCSYAVSECDYCPDAVRCSFENLRFGVRTYNNEDFSYVVTRSDFENCEYGIYTHLTDREKITQNTFKVRQAEYQTAGIALYSSKIFTVEENVISGLGSPVGSLSYGIVVNNSDILNNDIYLNAFNDLHIGGQSEGNNAIEINAGNNQNTNPFQMSGLTWTCNDFYDQIELADLTVVNGRIDFFQGFPIGHSSMAEAVAGSARNRFSRHGEPLADTHDIRVSGLPIQPLQYTGLNTSHYFVDSYSLNWVQPVISSYTGNFAVAEAGMCRSRCVGDGRESAERRMALQIEIASLEETLSDPRLSGADQLHFDGRLRRLQDELDLLEHRMVTDLLMGYDGLSADFQSELADLNTGDLYSQLAARFATDLTGGSPEPEMDEPVAFMQLDEGAAPRKVEVPAGFQAGAFEVYPNPSQGHFNLKFGEGFPATVEVAVVDLIGRKLVSEQINTDLTTTLETASLAAGTYLLVVRSNGQTLGTQRIVIQQ